MVERRAPCFSGHCEVQPMIPSVAPSPIVSLGLSGLQPRDRMPQGRNPPAPGLSEAHPQLSAPHLSAAEPTVAWTRTGEVPISRARTGAAEKRHPSIGIASGIVGRSTIGIRLARSNECTGRAEPAVSSMFSESMPTNARRCRDLARLQPQFDHPMHSLDCASCPSSLLK
jgi:hypothetical protein